jgi:peptidyl-prolyl cis-trans isomerase A (cyclophilin A)
MFARIFRAFPARLFSTFSAALCSGVVLCAALLPQSAQATLVRFNTTSGPIDLDLFDTQAPLTVNNLLAYVRGRNYDNMFFHRLAFNPDSTPFVLQGGGNTFPPLARVASRGTVQNEFAAARSNLRGTVAMAKVGGNPNSATSEWFVNLGNNSAILDSQNGGFTVFGRVTTPSMVVVDALAKLQVINGGSGFTELPVRSVPTTGPLTAADLVIVSTARELPTTTATDSDRIFNYLEAAFPQFVAPASAPSLTGQGYYFRFYEKTNAYVGTKDGELFYLVPSIANEVRSLGAMADWLAVAKANGY